MHQKFLFFKAGHFSKTSFENPSHFLSTSGFGPSSSFSSSLGSGFSELILSFSFFTKLGVPVGELDEIRAPLRLTEGDGEGDGESAVLRVALFSVSWCRVHMFCLLDILERL